MAKFKEKRSFQFYIPIVDKRVSVNDKLYLSRSTNVNWSLAETINTLVSETSVIGYSLTVK